MIQFRKGIFETNSSSCHTLVIQKDSWYDNHCVDDTPYIVEGGYYGRCPQVPLESTEEKLNYIWTMVNDLWGYEFKSYTDERGNWIEEADREVQYRDFKKFNQWEANLQEMFPNTKFIPIMPGDWEKGIDHAYELENFADSIEVHPELLKYLLFSYSWIDISGDESANWPEILSYPYGELIGIKGGYVILYVKGN